MSRRDYVQVLMVLATLTFWSCSRPSVPTASGGSQEEKVLNEENVPSWVNRKPQDPGYYIGIGNAPLYDPDYQRNAKQEALEDLASEIKVEVSATSVLYQLDQGNVFREKYESVIKTEAKEKVQGHELVETWRGERQYWVYYRLSKPEYQRQRTEERQRAIQLGLDHFLRGKAAEEAASYTEAVTHYINCLDAVKNYLSDPLEVPVEGRPVLLANEAYQSIQEIFTGIRFSPDELTLSGKEASAPVVYAHFGTHDRVAQLPVTITYPDGKQAVISGPEGAIPLDKSRLVRADRFSLTVDKSRFSSGKALVDPLIESIHCAVQQVAVVQAPLVMWITGEEHNLGQGLDAAMLKPEFIRFLSQSGIKFVEDPDLGYDFKLSYRADTRSGTETEGLFVSFLDLQVSLFDISGNEVFSRQLRQVKGFNLGYTEAGMDAYRRAIPLLEENIARPIIQFIF